MFCCEPLVIQMSWRLTLCQRDGDDHAVSSPHPQTISTNQKSCDSHKWEAQLARTYDREPKWETCGNTPGGGTSIDCFVPNKTSNENSPSILLTYGSMSTSWRCWCVCAWYRRRVESSRIDTHTPSPIHASCRTWLSLRGWASKDFCRAEKKANRCINAYQQSGKEELILNSPQSACFWAEWHESCSCSHTTPCHGLQPCSGWSDVVGQGPWGGSWTDPTDHLQEKKTKKKTHTH